METEVKEIDITELMSKLQKNTESTASLAETIGMKFDEMSKVWTANLAEVKKVSDTEAKLEEAGIMKMKVAGMPVVGFAAGAFGAVFASELVDGLMINSSKTTKGLVKGAAAFAVWKYGNKIPVIGKVLNGQGKDILAVLLAFDAVRDLTPLDAWAAKVANKVSGVIPTGGLADQKGRNVRAAVAVKPANSYYAAAMGRN
jgi:hypothetical protein